MKPRACWRVDRDIANADRTTRVMQALRARRDPELSGRDIVAPKRGDAPGGAFGKRHEPGNLLPVGSASSTASRLRIGKRSQCTIMLLASPLVKSSCHATNILDVGGCEGPIYDSVSLIAPPMAVFVGGIVIDEGDKLDVCAVLEDNELVLRFAVCMAATGAEGEVGGDPGGRVQQVPVGRRIMM